MRPGSERWVRARERHEGARMRGMRAREARDEGARDWASPVIAKREAPRRFKAARAPPLCHGTPIECVGQSSYSSLMEKSQHH